MELVLDHIEEFVATITIVLIFIPRFVLVEAVLWRLDVILSYISL